MAQLRDYVLPRLDSARRAADRSVGALARTSPPGWRRPGRPTARPSGSCSPTGAGT
ncbi:hypothetical protein [Micromonospora echinospora]|uniref:hypothetical protein n=1 Tax=Micromonospora echinospora TaxID=1877 RepID=UPI003A88BCF9